ncbi:MAG TPA: XRE family transcriptional regulator [Moraxellaceae bacterium]|nr:XRE family transcriptional regulator [Moraxellaceae bacterium]
MATSTQKTDSHSPISNEALAVVVKSLREIRQWSQETLAELGRITVRTVQRVEKGESSSAETRRALAGAFELEDINFFNNPFVVPTNEELVAEKARLEKEYLTIDANILRSGRELGCMAIASIADISDAGEASGGEEREFASLVDLMRDFRDVASDMSEIDKLGIYQSLQDYLDSIKAAGLSVCYALRKTTLTNTTWSDQPTPVTVLYLSVFAAGSEPSNFQVHRKLS